MGLFCCFSRHRNGSEDDEEIKSNLKLGVKMVNHQIHRAVTVTQERFPEPILQDEEENLLFNTPRISERISCKQPVDRINPGIRYNAELKTWNMVFWMPDCELTRYEFFRFHKITLGRYTNAKEFANEMKKKRFPITGKKFDDYDKIRMSSHTLLWENIPEQFNVRTYIGDNFVYRGREMRAYMMLHDNFRQVLMAFQAYKATLPCWLQIHMVTQRDLHFDHLDLLKAYGDVPVTEYMDIFHKKDLPFVV